jgi:hypothetical protein
MNTLLSTIANTAISMPVRSRYALVSHIRDNASLDVIADMTFKQAIPSPYYKNTKQLITEDIASQNIAMFLDRLNYKVYKSAYKRYDKKLEVITAIEGGKGILRENRKKTDLNKRFHVHFLLEQPRHFDFDTFKKIIMNCWHDTPWAYSRNVIEPLESKTARLFYSTKTSVDCVDLNNTHFNI